VNGIYEAKFSLRVQSLEENCFSDPVTQLKEKDMEFGVRRPEIKLSHHFPDCFILTKALNGALFLSLNIGIANNYIVYTFAVKMMTEKIKLFQYNVYNFLIYIILTFIVETSVQQTVSIV
jgi:hypothetical protein